MFTGVYTAIITPFRDGRVDGKKLEELVSLQAAAGVRGIVTCGTTGEGLLLSANELKNILDICVSVSSGQLQVIAGTGRITTQETIELTQEAEKAGASGVLVTTPWYVNPSQDSLLKHYQQVCEATDLPVIVYNNPTRTGVEIALSTLLRIGEFKNVKGYKESGTDFARVSQLKDQFRDSLNVLAGNDDTLAAYLSMGADGGILSAANAIPADFVRLVDAWQTNDLALFKKKWAELFPLLESMSRESNPLPIRYIMTLLHGVSPETRLPFEPLQESTQRAIKEALQNLGLWSPPTVVREQ